MYLRQNTAVTITLSGVVEADGITPEDSLTINQANVHLSKNGGTLAQKSDATVSPTVGSKSYAVTLAAGDTDTVGMLDISLVGFDTIPAVWKSATVLEESVYDALFASGATGYSTLDTADLDTALTVSGETLETWANFLMTPARGDITDAGDGSSSTIVHNGYTITYTYTADASNLNRTVTGEVGP